MKDNIAVTLTTEEKWDDVNKWFYYHAETANNALKLKQEYYVKEIEAPQGYALDETVYSVTPDVANGHTYVGELKDEPKIDPIDIVASKVDSETGESVPQGDGDFVGAQFKVSYYDGFYDESNLPSTATREWILETLKDPITKEVNTKLRDSYKVSGSDFYIASDGTIGLPIGTVYIQEIEAPKGYNLAKTSPSTLPSLQQIKGNGSVEKFVYDFVALADKMAVDEPVKHFGVRVEKLDAETKEAYPVGGATLEGTEFSIYNIGDNPVKVNGKEYAPVKEEDVKNGNVKTTDVVAVISTDKNGIAVTPQTKDAAGRTIELLPYSTYCIKETKAPEGYMLPAKEKNGIV